MPMAASASCSDASRKRSACVRTRPRVAAAVAAVAQLLAARLVAAPALVRRRAVAPRPVRRRWWWRIRRRSGRPRAGLRHSRIGLLASDRCGVGQGRQHLRRRRHRHQQSRRQVRQGWQVHHALGIDRHGPGPVHRREVDRRLERGRRLRRRRRQQAHPGVRRRRQVQVGVRQRRHAADDVHDARRDAVSLHLARRRRGRHGRRRHLQDDARRQGGRQVRQRPASR